MKRFNDKEFFEKSSDALRLIAKILDSKSSLSLGDLEPEKTILVIIDMVNGFAKEGPLSSPRIGKLIREVVKVIKLCDKKGIQKIAFADHHSEDSPEFDSYPVHCLGGTEESEIVQEIAEIGNYVLIPKNSTNGFLEEMFKKWLDDNPEIVNFIVVGDCTDICIQQFALTLKAYFNKKNRRSRIIVPINAVETYDHEHHYAELMNAIALYNMMINGIEIVSNIE